MSGYHEEISCNTELSTPHPAVLYCLKLGIIRGIISEHAVAMGTVKNAFKLVTQLVDQRRSLSWLSHCKREKVYVQLPCDNSLRKLEGAVTLRDNARCAHLK